MKDNEVKYSILHEVGEYQPPVEVTQEENDTLNGKKKKKNNN